MLLTKLLLLVTFIIISIECGFAREGNFETDDRSNDEFKGEEISSLRRQLPKRPPNEGNVRRVPRHWSSRKRVNSNMFSAWTLWTVCDSNCRQFRQRYCKNLRKCSGIKRVEERRCPLIICRDPTNGNASNNQTTEHLSKLDAILQKFSEQLKLSEKPDKEYYVFKTPKRRRPERFTVAAAAGGELGATVLSDPQSIPFPVNNANKPVIVGGNQQPAISIRIEHVTPNAQIISTSTTASTLSPPIEIVVSENKTDANVDFLSNSKLDYPQDDMMDYESDSYVDDYFSREDYDFSEEATYPFLRRNSFKKPNRVVVGGGQSRNEIVGREEISRDKSVPDLLSLTGSSQKISRRVYTKWSRWSKCSAKCITRRWRRCRIKEICGNEVLREVAYCYTEASFCEEWIVSQMYSNVPSRPSTTQAPPPLLSNHFEYSLNRYPMDQQRRKPTEIQQRKLNLLESQQCGMSTVRGGKSRPNVWELLKIIGGKTARKGAHPWQVAIFNRFKEAFCGGTLISSVWILTAAHCVRKRLYVRLGEHNLEIKDGTEVEYRVEQAIKHPKYDKRTVDNDVALLKLPKEMTPSAYIGFACLPQKAQNLPIGSQCTIIGWGKRRNQDEAGTNVLQEAEVPIVTSDECKAVYYDYTITKNMFCAGHKRGRIDTCAGDSGGPLLCRDLTKIKKPWTVFGITSFGDGCGKKNKFGIYSKIPNYIDWIMSVVNCNGHCKKDGGNYKFD